ncbi:MAG: TadE/TadG family type IV pilus assembly protein [Eubacterium sp.]
MKKTEALKKSKRENGQAMVEFVLVLPIFLLLICIILDFGWLFYNYISVENAARNAARVACVEYTECCYDEVNKSPILEKEFDINGSASDNTEQENSIIAQVSNTLPDNLSAASANPKVKVSYTYDTSLGVNYLDYDVTKRSQGDVIVTVTCDMKVLTPVLGSFSGGMTRTLTSSSTYKVEKNAAS